MIGNWYNCQQCWFLEQTIELQIEKTTIGADWKKVQLPLKNDITNWNKYLKWSKFWRYFELKIAIIAKATKTKTTSFGSSHTLSNVNSPASLNTWIRFEYISLPFPGTKWPTSKVNYWPLARMPHWRCRYSHFDHLSPITAIFALFYFFAKIPAYLHCCCCL